MVIIWVGQKVRSAFRCYGKPERTFWPTQYFSDRCRNVIQYKRTDGILKTQVPGIRVRPLLFQLFAT